MENTIENVIRFIFETETTPLQEWFDKNGLYYTMSALNGGQINDRRVISMDICRYTEPVIAVPPIVSYPHCYIHYIYPDQPPYVEFTVRSRADVITIGKLYTQDDVHNRYIKRAIMAGKVFAFDVDRYSCDGG